VKAKTKLPKKPTPKGKVPAEGAVYLLNKLLVDHDCMLFQEVGKRRYETRYNFTDGTSTPMVAVRLLVPARSAYGKALDAHYQKSDQRKAAAKPGRKAKAKG
jgi:hypothetical protein